MLWAELQASFAYDIVVLQVLEREGYYHVHAVDRGILQDSGRYELSTSLFAGSYERGETDVILAAPAVTLEAGRGPGSGRRPQMFIFVPIRHHGAVIGAVICQLYDRREVPRSELGLLDALAKRLGVIVNNAWLNEMTRNQALRLNALNEIARALSTTHDEAGIVQALRSTIGPIIAVDRLELLVAGDPGREGDQDLKDHRVRQLAMTDGAVTVNNADDPEEAGVRTLQGQEPVLLASTARAVEFRSAAYVPLKETGAAAAALGVLSRRSNAYEDSTVTFLEQVADQVSLALRNAWSYSAIEAQRHRLEVVDAVGRRLASSLSTTSIMRTLREELARHINFDIFSLAIVKESAKGPVVEGFVYDSGHEQPLEAVPLAVAGPSREAYETGQPILIRRSPYAAELEAGRSEGSKRFIGAKAVLQVTRPGKNRRVASRSILWVPVRHGDSITALLTIQSYQSDAFDQWHVDLLQDVAAHASLALATARHFEGAQTERRRLETILRHSPIGVVLETAAGVVVYANAVIEHIYGVTADGLVGRQSTELLDGTEAELMVQPDQPEPAPNDPREYRLGERVVRVRAVPIPGSDDQPEGLLTLHEDVTEERALMDAKDLMLRAIGHEVRSPAAAMRSTIAGLVQWGEVMDPALRQQLVGSAYEQSERLLSLVENQLIIAKLETAQFEPNPVPVPIPRTMEQVLAVLKSRYAARTEIVDITLAPDLPDAWCEPSHLEQVLTNLVGNALEHTEAGRVGVRVRQTGESLEITVEDNGGGLPPERIDQAFSRSGAAGHRARGGLGLGLYLCRLVVERSFGGRIWVAQTGRAGTTFKFTVPAAIALAQPQIAQ